jgi:ATPase subunit of ABC transporter with duplicated ATPase domains
MVLKIDELAGVDFTKRDEIVALFPLYKRQQLASKKPLPKSVKIENFTMKTPYGDQVLMQRTDLIIEPNRRQCLIGPNCSGKTLLFHNIVTGKIPDFPTHLHVHHCKELESHEMDDTVLNTVVKSNPFRNTLVSVEAKIKELLASPDLAPERKTPLTDNLEFVVSMMNTIDGYHTEEKAQKMLRVLGFDEVGQNRLVSALSGGLKMRVALCIAFIKEADLLLLDEPTNHLDFPSVLWLENRLRGYKGSFLLVSHDRELLKNVCTSVMLLEDKEIRYYSCGFIDFEKKKALEDTKKYDDIEKFLKKNKDVSPATQLGRQVLDKRTWSKAYHDKLVALQTKFTFPARVPLEQPEGQNLPPDDISLINLQNVRFSYNVSTGHFIFNDPISFNVTASTRVGVMGPNGAGKSTLLKLLTHKLTATQGSVVHHPNFKLAYFGQHSTAELEMDTNAIEFMMKAFPDDNPAQLRNHLAKTGIVGHVADTRVEGLSYSQRSCIVFAKLTYEGPHLLIMDEPTNFLDLESVDSLIGACNKYKGALLLVSHNRDFLKKCAKQYLSVVPGRFELYNDLQTAEKATYTFIQEMETGVKVGREVLVNNPGGGSVHSSQKVETTTAVKESAPSDNVEAAPAAVAAPPASAIEKLAAATTTTTTTTPTSSTVARKPASAIEKLAAATTETFVVGEKCQAKYSVDGRWYKAVVKSIKDGSYQVTYPEYGNTEFVPASSLRKFLPTTNKKAAGAPHHQQNRNNRKPSQA